MVTYEYWFNDILHSDYHCWINTYYRIYREKKCELLQKVLGISRNMAIYGNTRPAAANHPN